MHPTTREALNAGLLGQQTPGQGTLVDEGAA